MTALVLIDLTVPLLVVGVFAILVAIWGLCAMAKYGDEQLDEARRNLKGPESRDRLGL